MARRRNYADREKAFQLYAKLHCNKSAVGREMGIPVQTIAIWCKEEDWDNKLRALQTKLRSQYEILQKAKDNVVLQNKIGDLNILEAIELKVAEALTRDTGQLQINSMKDAILAMEFVNKEKRLILGEPTERAFIETTAKNEKQLDDEIDQLTELVRRATPIPSLPASNSNGNSSQ